MQTQTVQAPFDLDSQQAATKTEIPIASKHLHPVLNHLLGIIEGATLATLLWVAKRKFWDTTSHGHPIKPNKNTTANLSNTVQTTTPPLVSNPPIQTTTASTTTTSTKPVPKTRDAFIEWLFSKEVIDQLKPLVWTHQELKKKNRKFAENIQRIKASQVFFKTYSKQDIATFFNSDMEWKQAFDFFVHDVTRAGFVDENIKLGNYCRAFYMLYIYNEPSGKEDIETLLLKVGGTERMSTVTSNALEKNKRLLLGNLDINTFLDRLK